MSRRTIILCLIIFSVIAFSARVGLDIFEHAWKSPNAMEHPSIAQSLVNGKGFYAGGFGYYGPTSVQSPPFPFLLAGMYEMFGSDIPKDGSLHGANRAFFAIMILNAFAGAGLVWLTYLLTRTVGGSELAALIAAALVAVWPTQVYAARAVQAISMITCGMVAMTILYYRSIRSGKAGPWVGFSIVAAIATLTEPVILPALLLSGALILVCRSLPMQARIRNAAILALAVITIIGPWSVRNYIVHDKIIPIKGSFWVNVWKGNNDYATGTDRLRMTPAQQKLLAKHSTTLSDEDFSDGPHQYDMLDPSQMGKIANQPEPIREGYFQDFAMTWIKEHPRRYAELCFIRLYKTIIIDWDNPKAHSLIYIGGRIVLLLLTLGGVIVAWKQRWAMLFPLVLICTALASYMLTVTAARFAIPFEPFQLALGGALIAALLPKKHVQPQGFPVCRIPSEGSSTTPAPAH
jgi:4-amino-4-deoxy-L-arabinose transferase-like glycosyltransferase